MSPIIIPIDPLDWADELDKEADRLEETGEEITEVKEEEEDNAKAS